MLDKETYAAYAEFATLLNQHLNLIGNFTVRAPEAVERLACIVEPLWPGVVELRHRMGLALKSVPGAGRVPYLWVKKEMAGERSVTYRRFRLKLHKLARRARCTVFMSSLNKLS